MISIQCPTASRPAPGPAFAPVSGLTGCPPPLPDEDASRATRWVGCLPDEPPPGRPSPRERDEVPHDSGDLEGKSSGRSGRSGRPQRPVPRSPARAGTPDWRLPWRWSCDMREGPVDVESLPMETLRTREGLRYLVWSTLCRSMEAGPGAPCCVEGSGLRHDLGRLDFVCVSTERVVGILVHAGPALPVLGMDQVSRLRSVCTRVLLVVGDELPVGSCLRAIPADWGLYRLAGHGLVLERAAHDLDGCVPEGLVESLAHGEMAAAARLAGLADRGLGELSLEEARAVLVSAGPRALTRALHGTLLDRRTRRLREHALALAAQEDRDEPGGEPEGPARPECCPRCGSTDIEYWRARTTRGVPGWRVACGNCRHRGAPRGSREAAVEAWNGEERRMSPYIRVGRFAWMRVKPLSEADVAGTFWEG